MAFTRAHRFIRRGLKPVNVLLDRACGPGIGDFGLLKFSEGVATLSQLMQAGAPVHGFRYL
jgi:serine/threonine protein kinase